MAWYLTARSDKNNELIGAQVQSESGKDHFLKYRNVQQASVLLRKLIGLLSHNTAQSAQVTQTMESLHPLPSEIAHSALPLP